MSRPITIQSGFPTRGSRRTFVVSLAWAALVFVAAHSLDIPGSLVDFTRASGGGVLLDLQPSFSEKEIYERLTAYGPTGRENYMFRNVTMDVLLPLSLLPLLYLLMRYAVERVPASRVLRGVLLAIPAAYVFFDLAENASVLALLVNYPDRVPSIASVLPYLTIVKRTASLLALAIPFAVFSISSLRSAARNE